MCYVDFPGCFLLNLIFPPSIRAKLCNSSLKKNARLQGHRIPSVSPGTVLANCNSLCRWGDAAAAELSPSSVYGHSNNWAGTDKNHEGGVKAVRFESVTRRHRCSPCCGCCAAICTGGEPPPSCPQGTSVLVSNRRTAPGGGESHSQDLAVMSTVQDSKSLRWKTKVVFVRDILHRVCQATEQGCWRIFGENEKGNKFASDLENVFSIRRLKESRL